MYSQEITRTHRSAFVLVLDRSASMQQQVRFGELLMSKAEAVAYTANILITELIDRSRRKDGVRNYYDIKENTYEYENKRKPAFYTWSFNLLLLGSDFCPA